MYDQNNKNQQKNQDFQSENGSRLRDINQFGKAQPWKEKKTNSVYYADILELLEFKKAYNVKDCGQYLEFAVSEDDNKRLKQAFFCKSKLCPLCNWRRSKKLRYQVMEIVQACIAKEPKGRWLFLTLTCRNVSTKEELDEIMREMTKAFHRLFKYKKVAKNILGFLRGTEVTVNRKEGTYHPHFHVLLFVKSVYFNAKDNYINQEEWTKLWQKAMKLDYTPVVNVKAVKATEKYDLKGAILETAKYPVKPFDLLNDDFSAETKDMITDDLTKGLHRKRQIGFGKLFKEIRKELQLEDIEEGDLISVEEDDENTSSVKEVIAKWNWERKNYYLD